jgi:tetratricopeptide (TPR) repeat protein
LHDPLLGANRGMKYKDFRELWAYGDNPNKRNWTLAIFPGKEDIPFPELKDNYIFHVNMATAYYRKKEFQKSIWAWEKAIFKSIDEPLPYYCIAQVFLDTGQLDEAIQYALKALEIDDGHPFAYDVLGLAYEKKGMILESAEALLLAAKFRHKKHDFIFNHWIRVRDLYINMRKSETLD